MFTNRAKFNTIQFNALPPVTASGGSEATVNVGVEGSGKKIGKGSSEVTVNVGVEASGQKEASNSS